MRICGIKLNDSLRDLRDDDDDDLPLGMGMGAEGTPCDDCPSAGLWSECASLVASDDSATPPADSWSSRGGSELDSASRGSGATGRVEGRMLRLEGLRRERCLLGEAGSRDSSGECLAPCLSGAACTVERERRREETGDLVRGGVFGGSGEMERGFGEGEGEAWRGGEVAWREGETSLPRAEEREDEREEERWVLEGEREEGERAEGAVERRGTWQGGSGEEGGEGAKTGREAGGGTEAEAERETAGEAAGEAVVARGERRGRGAGGRRAEALRWRRMQ